MRVIVVIFCLLVLTHCKSVKEDIAKSLLESRIYNGINTMEDALRLADILEKAAENYTIPDSPPILPFPCLGTGRSNPSPTKATELLPGDIDLVITLGDSIAAAFIASLVLPFVDNRAFSFCGGSGYPLYNTLPYCLKSKFNADLDGFSIGDGDENSPFAKLNVAHDGDTSYELVGQANNLFTKLSSYTNRDTAWKHISIFIGGNDLCKSCNDGVTYNAILIEQT